MKFSVRTLLSAAILLGAERAALPQSPMQKPQLQEIASGKTRVIDLSYALSDKLVPWPGDAKAFEAKVNATVEKNGYFTRSFWMLEHYGTHMDAPAHFPPGITTVDKIPVDAAKLLLERKISGLGCDTLSIDPGNSKDFPVHHLVLGADAFQLENLADLQDLPEAGAFLIAAPIKLEGGSGGPVRVFGLVAEK